MNFADLPAQYHQGIDLPFGSVQEPNWPYRVDSSPIFSSPAMNCTKETIKILFCLSLHFAGGGCQFVFMSLTFVQNTYVPSYEPAGKPIHQVVDELASDNEYWAEMFMEGWQDMVTNRIGPTYLAMQISQKYFNV